MRPRSVFISGASSGIGRSLAFEYARRGADIAICARRRAELDRLANEIEALGRRVVSIPLDVRDASAVKDALLRADRELGGLEMVIANAGIGSARHSSRLVWEDVAAIVDVNLRGAMATLVAAIPIFLAQQRGHLVGISSLAGRRALPKSAAYSASKAALSTFLEALRIDLSPAGLHVTDVRPGFVDTAMIAKNTHPTPFRWPVDKATRHIVQKLESAPAVIAFPWQLVLATSVGRVLPTWLYERAIRRSKSGA